MQVSRCLLPPLPELAVPLSDMSVDNGSATTAQSSKVDRQAWSGSDYDSSSSNDFNDYYTTAFPFPFAAIASPSTSSTRRVARRVEATISLVEGTLPSKRSLGRNNPSRAPSLSEIQRRPNVTTHRFDRSFARHDAAIKPFHRPSPQLQKSGPQSQVTYNPVSSSPASSIRGPDDWETEAPQNKKIRNPPGQIDTQVDDEEKLERLVEQYSRLHRQRRETWEIFDWIRKERTQLHGLRERRASANRAFMAAAQNILPENPELVRTFKRMEESQFEFDSALDRLEDRIDEWEGDQFELELEEQRFYSEAARPDSVVSSSSSSRPSTSDSISVFTLTGIPSDRPEDVHPLFEELLETFKDLQLAKEFWEELKLKRRALEAKISADNNIDLQKTLGSFERAKILMARHYKPMSDEEVEFLQEYDDLEKRAASDIDSLSEKARDLRIDCLGNGVMPKNTPYREEGFGFDPFFQDDIRLGDPLPSHDPNKPRTLVHNMFHVILSDPIHLLEAFPQTPQQSLRMATSLPPSFPARQRFIDDAAREDTIHSLIRDADPEDKCDYINRWLLHKLHLSALEAEILYSTFRVRLQIRDVNRWQQDVLDFWTLDQAANLPAQQFQGISEAPSIESKIGTPKPTRHVSDSGQLDFMGSWDVDRAWP